MATAKVKQFWTAFVSVLFALLSSVGLTGTASAAARQPGGTAVAPAVVHPVTAAGERVLASVPAQRAHRWPSHGDRSLPPTLKQRIAAEAHGSSPAARHRSSADPTVLAEHEESAALAETALSAA
ncbi:MULTISPECIES: DUF6344 domain-containing protein [unclassified Streptomyces]|uniref:DUF6344 domain-containing protein n=1 Tax=unclassified Streptomyces TaxID=2593676 RepID=UPI0016615BA6|nr:MULTISPECIES: DUF6344 domain-containing protein [unclassified Streptomyces]MBD0708333.1 hypothetical protein [Streptomyces sp. CBMA291]MBD0717389.1 hypothetical protein [Streptomyces sp. CBMA370]